MMEFDFNNGDEYADAIINDLKTFDNGLPEDVIDYWSIEIRQLCNVKFLHYITGEEETYALSDVDLEQTFRTATEKLVGDTLGNLVDKGMVKMSIGDDGEVLYSSTEEGRKWADKH
jgi:hypothetical protein